ncbi:hypothetical protein A8709_09710 [Paenibacillus pectinilyticus]|uniref:DUF2812 domain-containing protein n=1 Tax=Paenibacillus pectinilyticus TaxID=512399 RepID=A0A1C1A5P4_9BACL|nr:DUF2812 domain-containing protein [Paenibacillus pectinilyticus]OCT15890.1 hypothetical protein A8709_09710 [Paenibacillus pectinilyticus]
MIETKKVFKWWDGSQSEKISTWLEEMEAQGWHVVSVRKNALQFHFEKGAPRKISYCVDYQMKADANYTGIFADAGWESIYSSAGWYIWRQPYTDTKPEIFTDIDSIIDRNKRLMGVFIAVTCAQIPILSVNLRNHIHIFLPLLIIYIPLFALLVACIYRLHASNKKLQAKKDIL